MFDGARTVLLVDAGAGRTCVSHTTLVAVHTYNQEEDQSDVILSKTPCLKKEKIIRDDLSNDHFIKVVGVLILRLHGKLLADFYF